MDALAAATIRAIVVSLVIAVAVVARVRGSVRRGAISLQEYRRQRTLLFVGAGVIGVAFGVVQSEASSAVVDVTLLASVVTLIAVWFAYRRRGALDAQVDRATFHAALPPSDRLRADGLKEACDRFGGVEAIAFMIRAPHREVADWVAGKVPIPMQWRSKLAPFVDFERREAAFKDAGLPVCDWVIRSWPDGADRPNATKQEIQVHEASCELCQARERFAAEHFRDW